MNTAAPQALHDAWEAMRRRVSLRHWPQDFDQVMADPVRRRLVQLEANARARRPLASPPAASVCRAPRPLPAPAQGALFDRKRAAAGERDDD